MNLNRKGFTLIELISVVVLMVLIFVVIAPGVVNNINKSKNSSYKIMVDNIMTASKNYFVECEYGDLSDSSKYGIYACVISSNKISITIGTLANTGFLSGEYVKIGQNSKEELGEKVVYNPKTKANINDCSIEITKVVNNSNKKVTYNIVNRSSGNLNCPMEYGSVN